MAESPEHLFLKSHFESILQNFSKIKLYGYTETDRKKFDFSCLLERDWSRPLVGQVLWRHAEGIDKDVRSLITDKDSEIKVYLASDTIKHQSTFEEVITDYKNSGQFPELFKLKPIWVPSDFDADKIDHQNLIHELLKNQIVEDILFNVVFGKISSDDIKLFLNTSGRPGLNLAILHNIATEGFINIATLQNKLDISSGPIREKLSLLLGTGFITTPIGSLAYETTTKGRIFLDIISKLTNCYHTEISNELEYILTKLDCAPVPEDDVNNDPSVFPKKMFIPIIRTIHYAVENWKIDFTNIKYFETSEINKICITK